MTTKQHMQKPTTSWNRQSSVNAAIVLKGFDCYAELGAK